MRVVIIGAGIGGLSAAIHLRAAGHEVAVYEAGPGPGGKLGVIEMGGYRFDAGPSLFTQPGYHAALFTLLGERQQDHFAYQPLEEVSRYAWPDGTRLRAWADPARLAAALAATLGEDEAVVRRYLTRAGEKFAIAGDIFLNNPLQRASTYMNRRGAWAVSRLHRLQMFSSLHALNKDTFRNPKTIQFFDRFATYNGSDPYRASALYSMIPSFEHGEGAYFPTEGMASIATSLEALARRHGVAFYYQSPVAAIELGRAASNTSGRAASNGRVRTKGIRMMADPDHLIEADAVVSNADVHTVYSKLLAGQAITPPSPRRALAQERSTSAMVFYWGIQGSFPELWLHNVFFSEDYQAEFADIFSGQKAPADPTVYVNITSKLKPNDAPSGCENWFVMVNLPARLELSTPEVIAQVRTTVLARLSKALGQDIAPLIQVEQVLTPALLEERTGAYQGALYGSASNALLSGFWRHANASPTIGGLYFTGGTVHPGGGIPLAIKSGQIAAGLVK